MMVYFGKRERKRLSGHKQIGSPNKRLRIDSAEEKKKSEDFRNDTRKGRGHPGIKSPKEPPTLIFKSESSVST